MVRRLDTDNFKAWYGGWHTDNFKAWYHQHSDCTINYTGSPNAMEKTAAEILWTSSVDKHDFRYTTMLSDGDSSTYARPPVYVESVR